MSKKEQLSQQQDLAATPTENVWVQANAGTGKTKVLIQRLLRILFRSKNITSCGILCLTYTNAGAGEMRNRILSALRKWALADDAELCDLLSNVVDNGIVSDSDINKARQIFFTYIDNPDILKIKTIHSFCEEILRRFPIEAGISPSWELVSGVAQNLLLNETLNRLVNSPENDARTRDAFFHIVNIVSEYKLDNLLKNIGKQYKLFFDVDDFDKYRKTFVDTLRNRLNIDSAHPYEFSEIRIKTILDIAKGQKSSAYIDNLIDLSERFLNSEIDFEEYKYAYLTKGGKQNRYLVKKDWAIPEMLAVEQEYHRIGNEKCFANTVAMFDLSMAFAQEYLALKKKRNLLDFDDLILYTRKLFSNPETMGWVLSQLDISLKHILVDEAQDTGTNQWDIMQMLSMDFFTDGNTSSDGHSLFVVGDTKQSIYGFQDADPNAFANSREKIGSFIEQNKRTIKDVPLEQSFRSTLPILRSVDKFFDSPLVASSTGFVNNPHKCFRQQDRGLVEIHKLMTKTDLNNKLTYVRDIAEKIRDMIQSGNRKASDIMILVKNRKPFADIMIAELKRCGLQVAGSDKIVLPNYPVIRDLMNLLRFCINTTDDYRLCCVLKSPLFRFSEQQLWELCNEKNIENEKKRSSDPQDYEKTTVYQVLQRQMPEIYEILNGYVSQCSTSGPYTFFNYVLNNNSMRENLISALSNQIIEPLDEFLTICLSYERSMPGTMRHFIKWFITGESEIKRDMDASDGVRIVTVHGSKGLEAPVVFLIDTTGLPKKNSIVSVNSTQNNIWLWLVNSEYISPEIESMVSEQYNTDIEEYYRLLYVAMTRARDELYIYGYTENKSADELSWHSMLWNVFANGTEQQVIRIENE